LVPETGSSSDQVAKAPTASGGKPRKPRRGISKSLRRSKNGTV